MFVYYTGLKSTGDGVVSYQLTDFHHKHWRFRVIVTEVLLMSSITEEHQECGQMWSNDDIMLGGFIVTMRLCLTAWATRHVNTHTHTPVYPAVVCVSVSAACSMVPMATGVINKAIDVSEVTGDSHPPWTLLRYINAHRLFSLNCTFLLHIYRIYLEFFAFYFLAFLCFYCVSFLMFNVNAQKHIPCLPKTKAMKLFLVLVLILMCDNNCHVCKPRPRRSKSLKR